MEKNNKKPTRQQLVDLIPFNGKGFKRREDGVLVNNRNTRIKDIAGKKYGLLTAIEFVGTVGVSNRAYWEFKCDCGNTCIYNRLWIEIKHIKSCGCLKLSRRDPLGLKQVYSSYKEMAEKRNLDFCLEMDFFTNLIQKKCFYCKASPSNSRKRVKVKYNGIDRIDSKKGYFKENVISCCFICNRAKGDLSLIEFKEWLSKIIKNGIFDETKIFSNS